MNTRPLAPVSSQPLLGQLNFQELIIRRVSKIECCKCGENNCAYLDCIDETICIDCALKKIKMTHE